jgi:hypothetical protein
MVQKHFVRRRKWMRTRVRDPDVIAAEAAVAADADESESAEGWEYAVDFGRQFQCV